jgi:hypothetical protein
MIEIPQPSIALNSHDVPGTTYEMWETWKVPANVSADWLPAMVSILSVGAENDIKCLIINCHGLYDKGINAKGKQRLIMTGGFGLSIGQGIYPTDAHHFSQIKGLVKCIIITACGAAHVTSTGGTIDGNGAHLCAEMARASGAYVIAPTIMQAPARYKLPKNHIDNFEGLVVRFNPSGAVDAKKILGRKLISEIV